MSYHYITSQVDLDTFLEQIKNSSILAIDTEFVREHTYLPILCLLQVCYDTEKVIVVDCLSKNLDISPLIEIIYNPNIVKVFHAGRQDLEILLKIKGVLPKNLFDTQQAVLALDFPKDISYEKMLKLLLNIDLNKDLSYSNWESRPLSKDHIEYAALDCLHLYTAYLKIKYLLEQQNRTSWIKDLLTNLENPEKYDFNPKKLAYKITSGKTGLELFYALEVCLWRENIAECFNLSRNKVLKNETIKQYLKKDISSFKNVPFRKKINPLVEENDINLLEHNLCNLDTTKYEKFIEKPPILSFNEQDILNILQSILRHVCIKYKVNSYLIASTEDLIEFCKTKTAPFMKDWKYEIFGHLAQKLINGQLKFYFDNGILNYE